MIKFVNHCLDENNDLIYDNSKQRPKLQVPGTEKIHSANKLMGQ
jgi:hypothetical protein